MESRRAYKVELDPTEAQRRLLRRHAGAARFAWNWGLARRIAEYRATGKSSRAMEQHRQLNALKKTQFPWMYQVSKCAMQEALRDLDRAFDAFYRRLEGKRQGKHKGKVGFPRFKSRKRGLGSFRLTGSIRVEEGRIRLPRLGWIRLKERGYIPTDRRILSATVKEEAGRWFVSVLVTEEIAVEEATGPAVGVDLGVNALATCSDGRVFENPRSLPRHEKGRVSNPPLRRLYRQLSRRRRGGRNWEKTRRKISRLHYRIGCIRRDALHKATGAIVAKTKPPQERPAVVVIEDLNVGGMLQNQRLAGAVADDSTAAFVQGLLVRGAPDGCRPVLSVQQAVLGVREREAVSGVVRADVCVRGVWSGPGPRPECEFEPGAVGRGGQNARPYYREFHGN